MWQNKRSINFNIVRLVTLTFNNRQLLIYNDVHSIKTKGNYGNKRRGLKNLRTITPSDRIQVTKPTRYRLKTETYM